jgi:hypothetical protein
MALIKPDQIPDEAVEAAAKSIYFVFTEINIGDGEDRWERLPPRFRAEYREEARAAIAAALLAWPGALTERRARCDAVVLPYNLDTDIGR